MINIPIFNTLSGIPRQGIIFNVTKGRREDGKTIYNSGYDIYIIARPSDFEQVILYYDTEIDLLEFDKDCELWVENGVDPIPKKITLGRILKLTGVNRIPLRSLKDED